jgi:ribosomal protein L7/L12
MKLDNIRFARVISYISATICNYQLSVGVIEDLNDLIDFEVPTPVELPVSTSIFGKASETDVNKLLYAFSAGDRKIEAIKAYRSLTGAGLKESKEAIEKYSPPKTDDQYTAKDYQFKLLDNVYVANSGDPDADPHLLDGFSDHQLRIVYEYITSFDYRK